jgi:transcriptional regulator with XRE-family HTH domain
VTNRVESTLRVVRRARGMGLRECAERAGIDPGHLSRVERGEAALSVDSLTQLARVLGLRELADLLVTLHFEPVNQ